MKLNPKLEDEIVKEKLNLKKNSRKRETNYCSKKQYSRFFFSPITFC